MGKRSPGKGHPVLKHTAPAGALEQGSQRERGPAGTVIRGEGMMRRRVGCGWRGARRRTSGACNARIVRKRAGRGDSRCGTMPIEERAGPAQTCAGFCQITLARSANSDWTDWCECTSRNAGMQLRTTRGALFFPPSGGAVRLESLRHVGYIDCLTPPASCRVHRRPPAIRASSPRPRSSVWTERRFPKPQVGSSNLPEGTAFRQFSNRRHLPSPPRGTELLEALRG